MTRVVLLMILAMGCGVTNLEEPVGTSTEALAASTGGVFATFDVVGERFSIWITNEEAVRTALLMWRTGASSKHPNGRLVCGDSQFNAPWSWHIDGSTVVLADVSIELCDGVPTHVETGPCSRFGNGSFCPWSAKLVELRDCRVSRKSPPACPIAR